MRWIAVTLLTLLLGASALADRIALKPSASAQAGAPVTLRDVADLTGPDAEALADTVLVDDVNRRAAGRAWFELTIDDVRATLDQRRVNWGRLSLQGASCAVRLTDTVAPTKVDDSPARVERSPETVDLTGPATVRTRIVALLTRLYDVAPGDLRVLFSEDDDAFLNTPEFGRRIEVQPAATASSSRFAVVVWVYDGDRLLESRTLRIDLQVRRRVFVLASELQRGDSIRETHLRAETMWLEPTGPAPIRKDEAAIGSVARRRLAAGTVLRVDQLESPVVVRRGELVTIHCLSGGVVVKTRARAQSDAREGDLIELRMDGRRKSFVARIVGPGRAVMNLDAPSDASFPTTTTAEATP